MIKSISKLEEILIELGYKYEGNNFYTKKFNEQLSLDIKIINSLKDNVIKSEILKAYVDINFGIFLENIEYFTQANLELVEDLKVLRDYEVL